MDCEVGWGLAKGQETGGFWVLGQFSASLIVHEKPYPVCLGAALCHYCPLKMGQVLHDLSLFSSPLKLTGSTFIFFFVNWKMKGPIWAAGDALCTLACKVSHT